MNSREGEELFQLKDNVGARINGYKLTVNKLRVKARRFLISALKFWNSCLVGPLRANK